MTTITFKKDYQGENKPIKRNSAMLDKDTIINLFDEHYTKKQLKRLDTEECYVVIFYEMSPNLIKYLYDDIDTDQKYGRSVIMWRIEDFDSEYEYKTTSYSTSSAFAMMLSGIDMDDDEYSDNE